MLNVIISYMSIELSKRRVGITLVRASTAHSSSPRLPQLATVHHSSPHLTTAYHVSPQLTTAAGRMLTFGVVRSSVRQSTRTELCRPLGRELRSRLSAILGNFVTRHWCRSAEPAAALPRTDESPICRWLRAGPAPRILDWRGSLSRKRALGRRGPF